MLITVFFILYLTLFPFDFLISGPASPGEFLAQVDRSLLGEPLDFVLNILLFVPFGFFLGRLRRLRHTDSASRLLAGLLAGFAFSFAIEFVQFWLLLRHAALADLLANTAGAGAGALLNLMLGNRLAHYSRALLDWEQRTVAARHYLLALATCAVVFLLLYGAMQSASRVQGWDPGYPLLIGNERTGDRQWSGAVSQLLLADRALPDEAVAAVLAGNPAAEWPAETRLSLYSLSGEDGTIDKGGYLPDLAWRGAEPAIIPGATGTVLGNGRWLETETSVAALSNRVMAHSEFTVGVVARPAPAAQAGPARIVSISTNPMLRNFTLGQDGDDLSLRLRMPFTDENGRRPEFIVPDLFEDGRPHHLLVTYDGDGIRIHVDTVRNLYHFGTTPASLFLWRLSPTNSTRVRLGAYSPLLMQGLFTVFWGIPFGFLSWRLWRKARFSAENRGDSRRISP